MKKYIVSLLVLTTLTTTQSASSDVLCMRNTVAANKRSVPLASAFRVEATNCPRGFTNLLNTQNLDGESGTPGLSKASYSNCTRRSSSQSKVNTGSDDSALSFTVTCNTGEYAYSAEVTRTYSYSNNWNHGGADTTMAGQSYKAAAAAYTSTNLLDANGIASAFALSVGGLYVNANGEETALSAPLTGSVTAVGEVKLLCCKTGR
jgi:hypothetical protein